MKNNEGFTFLELMIAFSIFSLLVLIVYTTFFSQLKSFDNNSTKVSMNIEANRAMEAIIEEIDKHNNVLVVNSNMITASGISIIDTQDDGVNNGFINVNNRMLVDQSGQVLCNHVESISFIMGPDSSTGISVMENVILVQIFLEKGNASYFLKGGVNIVK